MRGLVKDLKLFPRGTELFRTLDVIKPISDNSPSEVFGRACKAHAEWQRSRKRGGVPVIYGRLGFGLCPRDDEGSPLSALTFTARLTKEHPLFADAKRVAVVMGELLGYIDKELPVSSYVNQPALIYYGRRAWQRSRFPPPKAWT